MLYGDCFVIYSTFIPGKYSGYVFFAHCMFLNRSEELSRVVWITLKLLSTLYNKLLY